MTTKEIEAAPAGAAEQWTLDDLDHYVLDNGAYVFIGNVKDIMQKVESIGFQLYYILAEEKYYGVTSTGAKETTPSFRTQTFKVVNNMVGRSVTPSADLMLDQITSEVLFTLPKIPYELVQMMDLFFRKVDEKQGTEAILLLTYDDTIGGEQGWGVLSPEQSNTAAECDYKPESVADMKPDHVSIVGSVHSHPKMSAYASGTDHKDQADFDGLHITYGWQQSVNNGATQYYAELQMGGKAYKIDTNYIFSTPTTEIDEEVVEGWIDTVSKKTIQTNHVIKGNYRSSYTGTTGTSNARSTESYRVKLLPKDAPSHDKNIIVGVVASDEKNCPFCGTKLITADFEKRRCMACHQYLALVGESVSDVVSVRHKQSVYTHDIDPEKGVISKPVYLWDRNAEESFVLIYAVGGGEQGKK